MVTTLRELFLLVRKELRTCLRDQDVWVYAVLFPLILYPLVAVIVFEASLWMDSINERHHDNVTVVGAIADSPFIMKELKADTSLKISTASVEDGEKDLKSGKCKALVEITSPNKVIIHMRDPALELVALQATLHQDLNAARAQEVRAALKERGVSVSLLQPFRIKSESIKSASGKSKRSSGLRALINQGVQFVFAYVIGVLILVGKSAATCMLVEEREKKTLTTTLLLPVHRGLIVLAKFVAVTSVIIFSACVHATSLSFDTLFIIGISLIHSMQDNVHVLKVLFGGELPTGNDRDFMVGGIRSLQSLSTEIHIPSVSDVFFFAYVIFSAAILLSALFLFVSSFAKTAKQSESLSTAPGMICLTMPFVACIPGIELNFGTALVPLANLLTMMKFENPPLIPSIIAIVWNPLLAVALLVAMTVMFEKNTGRTSWRKIEKVGSKVS